MADLTQGGPVPFAANERTHGAPKPVDTEDAKPQVPLSPETTNQIRNGAVTW